MKRNAIFISIVVLLVMFGVALFFYVIGGKDNTTEVVGETPSRFIEPLTPIKNSNEENY